MPPITFVLFSYNEEKRISYAIRCFRDFGPVLIIDGGSTDRTREVSEELGATFLSRPASSLPQVETQQNFDFIKAHVSTPWIYWGYVDNIALPILASSLVDIAKEGKYKQVFAPMHTYMWGNTKHVAQKSYIPVAFHRDFMDFSSTAIHNMGTFTGNSEEVLRLPNSSKFAIRHFSTYVTSKYIPGHLRYAEEEARQKFKDGARFSVIKLIAAMLRYIWIYRRTLLDGKIGIIITFNAAFGRFMTYARLYELEHDITLNNVEYAYSAKKEALLAPIDEKN